MAKKIIVPVFYIAEWVFFLYVFLFVLTFNLLNYVNFLLVDMPGEERVPFASSTGKSLLILFAFGLVCFIYIRYLAGHRMYRKVKAAIWGFIFTVNSLSCVFCFSISFTFELYEGERLILLLAACISIALVIQIGMKYHADSSVD